MQEETFNFRFHTLPRNKKLYHGTLFNLESGYPTNESGNWFALNKDQSAYHVVKKWAIKEHLLYHSLMNFLKLLYV